jgi:hypothetical protein
LSSCFSKLGDVRRTPVGKLPAVEHRRELHFILD